MEAHYLRNAGNNPRKRKRDENGGHDAFLDEHGVEGEVIVIQKRKRAPSDACLMAPRGWGSTVRFPQADYFNFKLAENQPYLNTATATKARANPNYLHDVATAQNAEFDELLPSVLLSTSSGGASITFMTSGSRVVHQEEVSLRTWAPGGKRHLYTRGPAHVYDPTTIPSAPIHAQNPTETGPYKADHSLNAAEKRIAKQEREIQSLRAEIKDIKETNDKRIVERRKENQALRDQFRAYKETSERRFEEHRKEIQSLHDEHQAERNTYERRIADQKKELQALQTKTQDKDGSNDQQLAKQMKDNQTLRAEIQVYKETNERQAADLIAARARLIVYEDAAQ